ncbi:hypothetical protein OG897_32485 [Streptomyces sp. NBC_00237]|uniref:hypothetical protein n=1 Tax=Streptomyces sp. NBC_00237 TaxID=2975687 RepID=UPI00225A00E7|nr:hypothetical protein [Streptomyces sp. NBC_00237]MCX5206115.1 hypothetical protein [Streptomyces sp. NBC_00237]
MSATMLSAGPAGARADAEPDSIICHGGDLRAAFSPGVGFTKRTTQVSADGYLGVCNSPKHPKIATGTFRFSGSGTGACPGPFVVGYGKLTITWSNGTTSVLPQMAIRADAHTVSLDGGAVSEGPFRDETGRLHGRVTTSTIDMGQQCLSSGLTGVAASVDTMALSTS